MVLPREMEAADHEGWREDLDQELLLHLNSNNALCANDPDFFQKLRTALPSLNHSECSDYEEGSKDIDRKVKLDTEDIEVESFMDGENKEAKY